MKKDFWAHPTAIIDTDQIGGGTCIWAFTHIMGNVIVGANCNIGEHCFIESGVVIGKNVTIKNQSLIWQGVTLEDGVFVGPNVTFTNDLFPRSPRLPQVRRRYAGREWLASTCVHRGASIGGAAVLLPNITVGEFAMVGAGAVVTRNVPPYALVIGNPARFKDWVCQCGQPLKFVSQIATCGSCQRLFSQDADDLIILEKTQAGKRRRERFANPQYLMRD